MAKGIVSPLAAQFPTSTFPARLKGGVFSTSSGGVVIPTFSVTATQGGSTSAGMGMLLRVVNNATAVNVSSGGPWAATSITPNLTATPQATGSWVYGSILGLAGTVTAVSGTTIEQDGHSIVGLEMVSCRTTGTTTSGVAVNVGVTSTANGISTCLAEIQAGAPLTEDASSPAGVTTAVATTLTTATFHPPGGALLVLMVQANGGAGVTTMAITDTSGLGLTWTQQIFQNTATDGYSGIWTARLPGP